MTIRRISTEPPWSTRATAPDELLLRGRTQKELWGFGQHPATSLCLSILTGLYGEYGPRPKRIVELGCGSGLLCIAAAKLGAESALGLERDAALRAIAEENGLVNHADIRVAEAPPAESAFDLAIANLTAPELHAESALLAKLAPRGHLLIAGFVEAEREAIEQRFIGLGYRFLYREVREEVLASVFKARAGEPRGVA